MGRFFDPLETWRTWASDVRGRAVPAGHFLMEEAPEIVAREIELFLSHPSRTSYRRAVDVTSNAALTGVTWRAYSGTSMTSNTGAHCLARIWRGATTAADGDAYLAYLHATGISEYRRTPGNRGVMVLRRVVDGRAEFLLVTIWESEEAVRRFAGDDPARAVFYPEDDRYLIDRDERVEHYEVLYATGT